MILACTPSFLFLPVPRSSGKEQQQQKQSDMDPMFVVRCWNRIRVHILEEALAGELQWYSAPAASGFPLVFTAACGVPLVRFVDDLVLLLRFIMMMS